MKALSGTLAKFAQSDY